MKKAYVISVNMGYGHQRTAYPLKDLALEGGVICANDYQGIPKKDRKIWEGMRRFYEFISSFKKVPLVGDFVFSIFDRFQKISAFTPKKELSKPSFQLKQNFSLIKNGWGKDLILRLSSGQVEKPLPPHQKLWCGGVPLISTFFIPAFMAEYFHYRGEIFCVICDADISRAWASLNPKTSRIKYFAPNERVVERLKLYGVKPENIFLTGYPLPPENTGTEKLEILKKDLGYRLFNLDPKRRYFKHYEPLIKKYLGGLPKKSNHPLTIMFSVGGAGTQKEIGIQILKCSKWNFEHGKVRLILSAGIRERVKKYFIENIKNLNLGNYLGKSIEIIFERDVESYFQKFNHALRTTDILWTKPSELSFYSALGLPLIIAPTVGSQEEFNKRWLLKSGFGLQQENPGRAREWLFDWLEKGYLAEAAMQGFIEGEKLGTIKIKKIIEGR